MRGWAGGTAPLFLAAAACSSASAPVDPIDAVPAAQQRTITRNEFGFRWPFTAGVGTLGCRDGAVMFRNAGTTYALNDAGARQFPPVDPLRRIQGSGPPTDPVSRLTQGTREKIFAGMSACSRLATGAAACRDGLQASHNVTDDELGKIEAEGIERRWPPVEPVHMSLAPVLAAGLKLCGQ